MKDTSSDLLEGVLQVRFKSVVWMGLNTYGASKLRPRISWDARSSKLSVPELFKVVRKWMRRGQAPCVSTYYRQRNAKSSKFSGTKKVKKYLVKTQV